MNIRYNQDGPNEPAANAGAANPASGGVPAAEVKPAPIAAAAAPAAQAQAPAQAPSFGKTVEYLIAKGYTDEQVYDILTKPVEEPVVQNQPSAPAPKPQPTFGEKDVQGIIERTLAQREHNAGIQVESSTYAPDVARLAGTDAEAKAALDLIAQGIAAKIGVENKYPAGHPLAGQRVPLSKALWDEKGKPEFEKYAKTLRGSQIRQHAAAQTHPATLPISNGAIPTGPKNPWQYTPKTFDVNKFNELVAQRSGQPG